MNDLVKRDGLYYRKYTNVPFSGTVTGQHQGTIKDGKEHGPWVRYHENGQLKSKYTYKDGEYDGPFIVYHQNGQLEFKGSYKDRNLHGPWVTYFENGQLHFKGSYKDGMEEGRWVGYNEDGTVWELMTGTYKNGVKVK